jgi:small subunit ribosomal protein S9
MTPDEKPDSQGSEQGAVGGEPPRIAAEDAVGAQEQPTSRQLEREEGIADEPRAESEQRIVEATGPAGPEDKATLGRPDEPSAAGGVDAVVEEDEEDEAPATPRAKPEIPGADLIPDIVLEGDDPLGLAEGEEAEADTESVGAEDEEDVLPQPIAATAISLAAGARYTATGKRKSAVARVILRPGTGTYTINGRTLEQHFPRLTLQRQVRQALETVGLEEKLDVVARMHGGGVSAQSGALRHAISRALVDADPNLRSELKRRGFLTRDARVKERKKAGLKKARKRPQFSKR